MKKGKNIKLKLFDNLKTSYGTVDSKELKSIYINIQSWVTPKLYHNNWDRIVSYNKREIKYTVNESINFDIFKDNSIVDLDLRTSGIQTGKKSFFNLEITLYVKKSTDFKSLEVKDSIRQLISEINKNNIINNKYFDFSLCKNDDHVKQSTIVYLS